MCVKIIASQMWDVFERHCIYTFWGLLPPNGILPGAKLTLPPILAFTYIGSVSVQHSSSGR